MRVASFGSAKPPRAISQVAKKKRKPLDMAKEKRNNPCARGELCPQFCPFRRGSGQGAPFVAPLFISSLFALMPKTQNQKPAPLPRVHPAGAREVSRAPRRIAPRHNSRLPLCHWWA